MPEESKFAGALARLRKPPEAGDEAAVAVSPSHASGRAAGKRSDPEWANITLLMGKSLKKAARRRLEVESSGKDISTLIDELLTDWLSTRD